MIRKEAVVVKRNFDDVNDDDNYNYAIIKWNEQNEWNDGVETPKKLFVAN